MTINHSIRFFNEDCDFQLKQTAKISSWLISIIQSEGHTLSGINYVFCSDTYLLEKNREHLNHDYFTDIITFPISVSPEPLEADIFISIDRVKENAQTHNTSFSNELHRVLIHGLLHLIGYNDVKDSEKTIMRKKEDSCLSLRDF